jgi:type II secretion system protein I
VIVRTHHSRRSGLSLLEVLAALAIFLFSLVALSQLIGLGSENAKTVQWLGEASLLAQSRLAEIQAGSIALGSQSESTCDEDPDWSWAMDAEQDTAPGLYRVKITISRTRSDGSKFESVLNQMVLDPNYRGCSDGSDGTIAATPATTSGTTGTTGTGATGTGGGGGSATKGGN